MKKTYMHPITEAIIVKAKFCFLENSGELGDKEDDYESKSTSTVMEDLSSESRKSVNLWSDDENKED